MKHQILLIMSLLLLSNTSYAGSIYKCVKENGQFKFTDKPCGKLKGEIIHQETAEEVAAKTLKNKTATIGNLIRSGRDQAARTYAKKHDLDDAYKEELKAYNLHLEQQIKQQELAAKKQDKNIKKQQLLMQKQSLILQQQQLEQDKQQAATAQEQTRQRYYPYASYYPYNSSSTANNCQKYGTGTNCKQPYYGTQSSSTPEWQKTTTPEWQKQKSTPEWQRRQLLRNKTYNRTGVSGNVSVQIKDNNSKTGVNINGSF